MAGKCIIKCHLWLKDYMHIVYKCIPIQKQVDILISKNQALQILHLKHCVYKAT